VDCEAPYGVGAPSVGDMTEFGAVEYESRQTFHGLDCSEETFSAFLTFLRRFRPPYVMVSDNPAYDWQWINFYLWRYFGKNPLGHSARRIGDFFAGLNGNFGATQAWKRYRRTPHDHNPVNDAMGNVEAFERMLEIERAGGYRKPLRPRHSGT